MKYPGGITTKNNNYIKYNNRGMSLEEDINCSNEYYLVNNKAVIHKKPTPIQITKVDYNKRNDAIIKEAFFKTPSTTDYNGIYKGKYIDFEAKETKSKTSFPLKNIHAHQIEHIKSIIEHKGIAFLIIRFTNLDKTFLLKGESLLEFINKNNRRSIPISYFHEYGFLIENNYNPRLDYLKIIDEIYFGGDHYGQK